MWSLSDRLLQLWREKGLKEPTEIQKLAFPVIKSGKNALLVAPTGSGKTEAALLPAIDRVMETGAKPISILYITPLRTLNRDILERISWWGEKTGLTVDVRHGDTPSSRRARQAKNPPHILITTPESLQAILPAEKMGKHLKNVSCVIVDEVHELVAEKRGYQLSLALERLVEKCGRDFQRIGLSATVGSPRLVAKFLGGAGRPVEILDVSQKKEYIVRVVYPRPNRRVREEAKKVGIQPEVYARLLFMLETLKKHNQVLTFVNTRNMAEQLSFYFSLLHEKTDVHHSSLSREVRLVVEKLFRKGEIKHLIATSSMELGIDIGEVDAVIQYGSPRQVTRLVQRVGRSGHRWDLPSRGYIVAIDPIDFIESAVIAKLAKKHFLEPIKQETNPLDVLAHQIAGFVMDWGDISFRKLAAAIRRAQPFESISDQEIWAVIQQLEAEGFVRVRGDVLSKTRDTWRYYYYNLSMIPDEEKFFVVDVVSGKNVAMLDEDFVSTYLEPGVVFVVKGRPWRVVGIEERNVYAEPSESLVGAIPAWVGEQIPVHEEVAKEVARERQRISKKMETIVDVSDQTDIERVRKFLGKNVPDDRTIRIEQSDRYVIVHVPLGSLGNTAFSRVLSAEISRRFGIPVRSFSSPYAVILEFPGEFPAQNVKEIIESLTEGVVELLMERWLTRTNLFKWRFIHVARRFGLISRKAKMERVNIRRLIDALLDSPIYEETVKEILTEKLDIESVKKLIRSIKEGRIKVEVGEISPLGKRELAQALNVPELVSPEKPEKKLLELFKSRVLEKRVTLLCTSCLSEHVVKVGDVKDRVVCPRCGSPLVAVVKNAEKVKKILEKKRHTKEERRILEDVIRSAELVKEFGKKAIIALSVTGIGSQTAARILITPYTEEEFWKALLDAERQYYRTRMFWA